MKVSFFEVFLIVFLQTLIPNANSSTLVKQLSLIYRDTYLVYGLGRRSERDLPVCESTYEACNISHKRLWMTPITERLCRCARKTECPISYEEQSDDSQHVSNRAQYKFCEGLDEETMKLCNNGQVAIDMIQEDVVSEGLVGFTSRPTLRCKCNYPNFLVFNKTIKTAYNRSDIQYTCNKLPRCEEEEFCGLVRQDTFELYYKCSCLQGHLCSYTRPFTSSFSTDLPHFHGNVYKAYCTAFE